MPLEYVEKWSRIDRHVDSIDALAISDDGLLLASGSMDGSVVVSSVDNGTPLRVIYCLAPVLSLKWAPTRTYELWCGLKNGRLVCVTISQAKLDTFIFAVHEYPIEHLAFDRSGNYLATGAQHKLKTFHYISPGQLQHINSFPPPRTTVMSSAQALVVTSMHWLHKGRDAGCLIATYLHHGIVCWEPHDMTYRWTIPLGIMISDADLHPDETRIAIMNHSSGVEVWKIPSAILDYSIPVVITTGSDIGQVRVWNTVTKKSVRPLVHPLEIVRAVAAHYDSNTNTFRIATGNAESKSGFVVRVFEARELRETFAPAREDGNNNSCLNLNFLDTFGPRVLFGILVVVFGLLIRVSFIASMVDWVLHIITWIRDRSLVN